MSGFYQDLLNFCVMIIPMFVGMLKKAFVAISLTVLFSLIPLQVVHAAFWDSFVDDVKKLLSSSTQPAILSVESSIALAPGGDDNKNNEIDAGDIVRFTYTLQNTTDKKYAFGTLKTNIDRKEFNFFHNLQGTTNIVDDDKTINIVNVRLDSGETLVISFDARTLYGNYDKLITTEAEFIDFDKKLVTKAAKLEQLVKKNMPDFIPSMKSEKRNN